MPPRRSQEQVKKINSVTKEDLRKHIFTSFFGCIVFFFEFKHG
jgi:hypothetical protein